MKEEQTIDGLLFDITGIEDLSRDDLPELTDKQIERLRKMPAFTKGKRNLAYEWRRMMQLENN